MVEAFGNRSGQDSLFELLFGPQASTGSSFIANDNIRSINPTAPELCHLVKWDAGTKPIIFSADSNVYLREQKQ